MAHKLEDTAGGNVPDPQWAQLCLLWWGGARTLVIKPSSPPPPTSSEKRDTWNPEVFPNKGIGIDLCHRLVPLAQDSLWRWPLGEVWGQKPAWLLICLSQRLGTIPDSTGLPHSLTPHTAHHHRFEVPCVSNFAWLWL